jgi:hypothetical protein
MSDAVQAARDDIEDHHSGRTPPAEKFKRIISAITNSNPTRFL